MVDMTKIMFAPISMTMTTIGKATTGSDDDDDDDDFHLWDKFEYRPKYGHGHD